MLKSVFSAMLSNILGLVNLEEGILFWEGMSPIGAVLQLFVKASVQKIRRGIIMSTHDPSKTWAPFVRVLPLQKSIKLTVDVSDAAWPGSPPAVPSLSNPLDMTLGSRAKFQICLRI